MPWVTFSKVSSGGTWKTPRPNWGIVWSPASGRVGIWTLEGMGFAFPPGPQPNHRAVDSPPMPDAQPRIAIAELAAPRDALAGLERFYGETLGLPARGAT